MTVKRFAISALLALLAILIAGAASVALLVEANDRELAAQTAQSARTLATLHAREAAATRILLQHLCERDVQLERLSLELGAGGEPDISRLLAPLRAALRSDVWLLRERAGELSPLGAQLALPKVLPSTSALREATTGEHLLERERAWVLTSCSRGAGGELLWLVRAEPLDTLRTRLQALVPESLLSLGASDGGHTQRAAGEVEVLRIEGLADANAQALWLRGTSVPHLAPLLSLLPLLVLAIASCTTLVYLARIRAPLDEGVLVELEQAAERVARGDLSARITARVGGRADQTFRTFDRMAEELSEMRTRLAEAERAAAWQDMARRIAHEIKNPLSPIRTAIETLRKAHGKRLPAFDEIFDESTRAILEEVRRMEHIVREFSEFARLPRARPGALELGALVSDTVALYEPEDVQVEILRGEGPVAVRADREQITQVLVNLLQNALDAARTSERPRVIVRLETRAGAVFVHVEDSGPGIPPALRERVFEPYFTTKQHGTGLGLAIVKRIALDHEGAVQVDTSALGGARFTLRLPARAQA